MSEAIEPKHWQNAVQLLKELQHVCRFIESVTSVPCTGCSDLFTHGVHLALLSHHLAPECVPLHKIYDRNLARYEGSGNLPSFRHLDNINMFIAALGALGLPQMLHPSCRDVYEAHNLPQLVYCLRALELHLGYPATPAATSAAQEVQGTDAVMARLCESVQGCQMPPFATVAEMLGGSHPTGGSASRVQRIKQKFMPPGGRTTLNEAVPGKENILLYNQTRDSSPRGLKTHQSPRCLKPHQSPRSLKPHQSPRSVMSLQSPRPQKPPKPQHLKDKPHQWQQQQLSPHTPSRSQDVNSSIYCSQSPKQCSIVMQSPFLKKNFDQQTDNTRSIVPEYKHHVTSSSSSKLQQQLPDRSVRTPLKSLNTHNKQPSNMQEWVIQQRQLKSGSTTHDDDYSNVNDLQGKTLTPKKLFHQGTFHEKSDDYFGDEPQLIPDGYCQLMLQDNQKDNQIAPTYQQFRETYLTPHKISRFHQTSQQRTPSCSSGNPVMKQNEYSDLAAAHSPTPSLDVEFVKPLAPVYRTSSSKSVSSTVYSTTSSVPLQNSSVSSASCEKLSSAPPFVSSSVPCSPHKNTCEFPFSVSCEELSVVVRDIDNERHHSTSKLRVLGTEDHHNSASSLRGLSTTGDHNSVGLQELCVGQVAPPTSNVFLQDEQLLSSDRPVCTDQFTEADHCGNTLQSMCLVDTAALEEHVQYDASSASKEDGNSIEACLGGLYDSLQNGSAASTLSALQALAWQYPALPALLPSAAPLYHLEMYEAMVDAECGLSLEEVCGGVVVVGAVAAVNTAVAAALQQELHTSLTDKQVHLQDVAPSLMSEYLASMRVALEQLAVVSQLASGELADGSAVCPMLTYLHIQQIIDQVNTAAEDRLSQLANEEQLNISSDDERCEPHSSESSRLQYHPNTTAPSPCVSQFISPFKLQFPSQFPGVLDETAPPQIDATVHTASTVPGTDVVSPIMPRHACQVVRRSTLMPQFHSTLTQDIFGSLSQDLVSGLPAEVVATPPQTDLRPGKDVYGSDDNDTQSVPIREGTFQYVGLRSPNSIEELIVQDSGLSNETEIVECPHRKSYNGKMLDNSVLDTNPSIKSSNEQVNVEIFDRNIEKDALPGNFQNSVYKSPCQQIHDVPECVQGVLDSTEDVRLSPSSLYPHRHQTVNTIPSQLQQPPPQFRNTESFCQVRDFRNETQPLYDTKLNSFSQEKQQQQQRQSNDQTPGLTRQSSGRCGSVSALHDLYQYDHLEPDVSLHSVISSTSCSERLTAAKVVRTAGYLNQKSNWTKREIAAATRLQRWWRLQLALVRLQQQCGAGEGSTTTTTSSLLTALAPCLPLLPLTQADLHTEEQMQVVRSGVSRALRVTAQLQQEVDHLDLQIGLLLSNTMSIQDPSVSMAPSSDAPGPTISCVVDGVDALGCVTAPSPARKGKKDAKEPERRGTLTMATGLKALRKCSRDRLQGYQQLFYLLQTEPRYLATLIFALPSAKTTRFVESVVFSLYNYGANDRDNFLLINLFKTALEEEIRCKVLRISDIVSGEPLVIKMIVSFVRKGPGRAALREILGPLVTQVLEDPQLNLNTNPVEIYQTWLNEIEMETGLSSGSIYNVSPEEALQHPVVVTRLQATLAALTRITGAFCAAITASIHKLPYALLYLAGVMKKALTNRFPHIMDKEILKVVGSLIYYRYINSGIVAPDAFDVVSVGPHEQLNSRQRRNLATVAKTLQAAATKRGFGNDTPHLCALNPELITWHEALRQFFSSCCRVPEPDAVFAVTQYSEAALIHRPQIHITLQELYETHCLVLAHRNVLAPAADDALNAVLDDLPAPDLTAMGESSSKTEVCLTLSSKFSFTEPAQSEPNAGTKDSNTKLFDKSKQLAVDVLLCCGHTSLAGLQEVVTCSTAPAQERRYALLKRVTESSSDTLHAAKTRLSHNLRRLQTLDLASPRDGYRALLLAVAADVLSQRHYRASRGKELGRLSVALSQLQQKEVFMQEQRDNYLTYLTTCKANMMQYCRGKARRGASVTYSGKRLKEKGVLVDIRDFTASQYSSVAFVLARVDLQDPQRGAGCETASSGNRKRGRRPQEEHDNLSNSDRRQDEAGGIAETSSRGVGGGSVFSVTVKYRGVIVDTVRVSIQDLLHMQYEGVRVRQMAGGAQVNVNLLLHLLNTKFFSKKK